MSDAAKSDDPAAAYADICAGKRDGDPALQSTWALPHHSHPGDAPNVDGVHAALSRINQAQGLINRDAAQAHLDSHMTAIRISEGMMSAEVERMTLDLSDPDITLSVDQRRLGIRIVPYDTVATHPRYGALMFRKGAFGDVIPSDVRLRMDHADPPTGAGRKFWEADGAWMEFQLSKTSRADDQLALARDGVSAGASVGYEVDLSKLSIERIDGQAVTVFGPDSARLAEVSTTWQPTFADAGVKYVLSRDSAPEGEKGNGPVAESQEAPVVGAIDTAPIIEAVRHELAERDARGDNKIDIMLSAFEEWREKARADFAIPHSDPVRKPKLYDWMEQSLRLMRGQPVSPSLLQTLALDDVITTDNPGLVPDVFTADYDDLINQDRPFLRTTREVTAPTTGNSMTLPIITQRAVAGTQASGEKTDVSSTATQVGTGTFPYQSIFGGADISIQMILRADASFFDLLTGDLGMAYALDADTKALTALLQGYTDSASNQHIPADGGVLDPEDLKVGDAWQTSIEVYKRAPDTIWLNAAAVAAFIDAKAPLTNAPLYSNLAAAFTAGGGPGGTLSGLRPVYVPAMDSLSVSGEQVDVIIGPSRGFVWAEDPARRLTVDVPSKAGRDVALVGGLFPAPRFADAFTVYTIAAS
jgi:phage head maturation protease